MFSAAHSYPITCANEIVDRCFECRPGPVGTWREPAHGTRVSLHIAVNSLGHAELRHRLWQQLFKEQTKDLVVRKGEESSGIVKIAGHNRTLRLISSPQSLMIRLQLIEHEKGTACTSQAAKTRKHICWGLRGDELVQPDSSRNTVDTLQGTCTRKCWTPPRHFWASPEDRAHAARAEGKHDGIEIAQLRGFACPSSLAAQPSDSAI
mmetsp:Transcript_37510/g.67878  ORF Transcript_37510/g.67878 Transcript_37510/m.67878 type:complete len:207 (-) Transcript_37510:1027-1647(-)